MHYQNVPLKMAVEMEMVTKTRKPSPTQNGTQSQKPEKLNESRLHKIYSTNKSHNYVLIFVPLSYCYYKVPKHRRRRCHRTMYRICVVRTRRQRQASHAIRKCTALEIVIIGPEVEKMSKGKGG